jgi:hypothetical protein
MAGHVGGTQQQDRPCRDEERRAGDLPDTAGSLTGSAVETSMHGVYQPYLHHGFTSERHDAGQRPAREGSRGVS